MLDAPVQEASGIQPGNVRHLLQAVCPAAGTTAQAGMGEEE